MHNYICTYTKCKTNKLIFLYLKTSFIYYTLYNHFIVVMIQYYSVKHKHTSRESGLRDYNGHINYLEQLEYVTKGHIATQTILFKI